MDNIDPHKLDAIFQEGADKYEFEYSDAAWSDMAGKLDKRDRRRRLLWLLPLLLIGIVVAIAITKNSMLTADGNLNTWHSANTEQETSLNNIESVDEQSMTNESTVVNAAKEVIHEVQPTKLTSNKKIGNDTAGQSTSRSNDSERAVPTSYSVEAQSQNWQPTDDTRQQGGTTSTTRATSTAIGEQQSTLYERSAASNLGTLQDTRTKTIDAMAYLAAASPSGLTTSQRHIKGLTTIPASPEPQDMHCEAESTYFATLYAAPEWSSIGLLTTPETGWKVGMTLGTGIGEHLEIYTGVGISKKIYTAENPDYQMQGGWLEGKQPMSMSSKGYIVDIPLDVSYYVNGRSCSGFFFTGGLSSYFMSSEWYGFEYTPTDRAFLLASGVTPVDEVYDKNLNQHYFGVANVAAGYQSRLSNGMHLQISPYMQIPLTGIGSGKVDLYTAGIKVAMKMSR